MKFYLNDGVEIELAPELSKNIMLINSESFLYNEQQYGLRVQQFKIDDVYFLFHDMIKNNPQKKIFIHHFEPLANDFYAMYYAVEA